MCVDPATAATASLIIGGLGTAASAYGTIQQGKAQQAQFNYQAAVDRNNAIYADRAAEDAIKKGQEDERRQRLITRNKIADQRVALAENNIDLGSDSAFDLQSDEAMTGELEALTIRNNAEREAYGYRVQGDNYRSSAANNNIAGKNARSSANMGAVTTILGGASTVGANYIDFQNKGIFSTKKGK